jgi:hypothetical protein
VQPLVTIVNKIHDISSPPPGTGDATDTERDLARRLGQLQATTLPLTTPESVQSEQQSVTNQVDAPISDESDLSDRLDRLETQQRRVDTATRLVNQAAELAATAVANMIQIPNLGESEIVQIIREYLSGLVETSPLKDVFAAWAKDLTRDTTQPPSPVEVVVVPDPEQLEQAALATLAEERARVLRPDPLTPDRVQERTQMESPADAAVDLVNEVRYLDEDTGPCDGCPRPLRPSDERYQGPGEKPVLPVEPEKPPRIKVPIR